MTAAARLLIAAAGTLVVLLVASGPASAHAGFVTSQPEPGAELGTAPGVVILRFSEPLNEKLSRAEVVAPDDERFVGTAEQGDGVRVPLSTSAQGVYEVEWTSVSVVDGHTLTGSYRFGVGVSPGPSANGGTTIEPRAADLWIAVARTVEDAALLLALGMLLTRALARRHPRIEWVRARLGPVLAVALAGGILVVIGEATLASGSPSASRILTYLASGTPGFARVLRLLLEGLALGTALLARSWTLVPLAGAVVMLGAAGHAAATDPRLLGVTIEGIHLLSAGAWAGGITALAILRPPDGWRGAAGRVMLDRFTPVALVAFGITAVTGAIRGIQEVGSLQALVSAYGLALLSKVIAVAVMVQLSILAWRRLVGSLHGEAAVGLVVVAAAAILASFPLPPARLYEATAQEVLAEPTAALPRGGELTLGGDAGQVLVGLTLRPATPGPNDLFVYLQGPDGDAATEALPVDVSVGDRPLAATQCGPGCRNGRVVVNGGERVVVDVGTEVGGVASFRLPELPAASGEAKLERMSSRMGGLLSYRQDEMLATGLATIRVTYEFVAPDRMKSRVVQSDGGSETVWIGGARYSRELSGGGWNVEVGGPSPRVPYFIWDSFRPFVDPAVLGSTEVNDVPTRIVAFFGGDENIPVWFRLWIDRDGLVRRASMRAPGHFMEHRYYDFDRSIEIERPRGTEEGV